MKRKKFVLVFLCMLFFFVRSNAQKFTSADIDSIQWKIYDYLQTHQQKEYDSIPSEVVLVILQTDSQSRISSIHLMADERNKSVAYQMLSKMIIADLKGWHPKDFGNRSVIVPVYSMGIKLNSNYADRSFWDMSWSGYMGYIVNPDQKYSVMLSGVMYTPPPKGQPDMMVMPVTQSKNQGVK
jgi:hypothetical protein